MLMDVLDFLAFPESGYYSRSGNARGEKKADSTDIITPIDPEAGVGQWKHIKNRQGWPWDLKLYDQNYVYDWITEGENGWSSDPNVGPKSFKKFVQNHRSHPRRDDSTPFPEDGLIAFPRYVDTVSNKFSMTIPPDLTNYAVFENCGQQGEPRSLGQVRQKLHGPFQIDHGGDVGSQPTLIHQYFWTDMVEAMETPTLEENYYVYHFGWVAWKQLRQNPETEMYELEKQTVENKVFTVSAVSIVFPCF